MSQEQVYNAVRAKDYHKLQLLFENNPKTSLEHRDQRGFTPLLWCANESDDYLSMVQILLANKADIEATDSAGYTPISRAAIQGNMAILKELLSANESNKKTKTNKKQSLLISSKISINNIEKNKNDNIRNVLNKPKQQIDYATRSITFEKHMNMSSSIIPDTPIKVALRTELSNDINFSILVHNISHWNMLLSFQSADKQSSIIARIKFHDVVRISQYCYQQLKTNYILTNKNWYQHDLYHQYGFNLKKNPIKFHINDWSAFHIIKNQKNNINYNEIPICDGIYFPPFCTILPKWIEKTKEKINKSTNIIYLVAGSGAPMDDSSAEGNDTKIMAQLIQYFTSLMYPYLQVHIIHASLNVFKYDANVIC